MMRAPDEKLGFAHVETRSKERHLVFLYKENAELPVYVLDNQVPEILSAQEKPDLTATYIFTNDGRLYLIGDNGKKRYVKSEFANRNFEKWNKGK